jgi:hypothetical protein
MALAMGRTPEEEPKENLHKISQVQIILLGFHTKNDWRLSVFGRK